MSRAGVALIALAFLLAWSGADRAINGRDVLAVAAFLTGGALWLYSAGPDPDRRQQ